MIALAPLLIAASTVAGTAATSSSDAAPGPVVIDRCEVPPTSRTYGAYSWRPWANQSATTGALRIAFHDRARTPVTRVAFLVDYRGEVETVRDAGTFSPGASIDHTYAGRFVDFAYLGSRPNRCRVVSVTFADGSIWANPTTGELVETDAP
jgi:hypothetical protein